MSLKKDWKETGKDLGHAFKGLGKNVVRSVELGLDKVDGTASRENVFNDGSWRQTGKELGKSFVDVGKNVVKSAKVGLEKVDSKINYENEKDGDNVVYEYSDDDK